MINRRHFCLTSAAGLVAAALDPAALARLVRQDEGLTVRDLRDGAWAIEGQGGNSLLLATGDGPVLVDTKVATAGDALHAAVRRQLERSPALVINTHHHADHVGGNFVFSKQSRIVAHVNVRARLANTLDTRIRGGLGARGTKLTVDDFNADREVSDELILDRGGVELRLYHYGFGHTDNDVVVFLPEQNILHMGDLVFHELHPFIDVAARATTVGWQKSLAKAQELCDEETILIPGHGAITDRTGLTKMSAYFDELREIVRQAIANGRTREEVIALKPEPFKTRGFEQMQTRALGVVYDELKADS
ncbi:MAG: MBL fold metallo-hydrolase [Planctomycetota bacterium]|jgi:glyoxylase-like metal-dependent hydrolase (beta-lactamase superfamily II)